MTCTVKLQKVIKLDVYRCSTLVYIGIEFNQSHRPEEAIPILTISVNRVLCLRFHERLLEVNLRFL